MATLHIELDEQSHRAVKMAAAEHGKTIKALVERGLVLAVQELRTNGEPQNPNRDKTA